MTLVDFDQLIDRHQSGSLKWGNYGPEVLPLWVADMDFSAPESVLKALQDRISHGIFGYEHPSRQLREMLTDYLFKTYQWRVQANEIVFLPGVVTGFNQVCRAFASPGDRIISPSPVYPPVLKAPANFQMKLEVQEMPFQVRSGRLYYELDFDFLQKMMTSSSRVFILCHPQNPTGRDFSREELTRLAEICLRHQLVVCSDEIHSDLMLGGKSHTPLAALSEEIAHQCITLMAPSKTFNIPGLGNSFAIIQNPELRRRFKAAGDGIVPWVNCLGLVATEAAYGSGLEWLEQLKNYLTGNRDFLLSFIDRHFPAIRSTCPEATYLAWLDCRGLGLDISPYEFFLKNAKVAFNEGVHFGAGGSGFVRLNFGCPRATLEEALQRMKSSLEGRSSH
jgi:cysteine-S-conjugate beta-lyase